MVRPVGDLAARIQRDLDAAGDDTDERTIDVLLAELVAAGGALPTAALLDAAAATVEADGATADAVASAAVAALLEQPADGRKSPMAEGTAIGGTHIVSLTTAGYRAAGHPNLRGRRPSAAKMEHRMSILRTRAWLEEHFVPAVEARGSVATVVGGHHLTKLQHDRAEALRRALHTVADRAAAAPLTGGVQPDLLLLVNTPPEDIDRRERVWPRTWALPSTDLDMAVAIEVERSPKNGSLSQKLRNHAAAAESGLSPWWHAVLWATNDATYPVLARTVAAVEREQMQKTPHYCVPLHAIAAGSGSEGVPLDWPDAVDLGLLDAPAAGLNGLFA